MIAPVLADDSDFRFPSLASLRAAHAELLRSQRESSGARDQRTKIEDFIRRGQATGALLDECEDRLEAQSILDYWATSLFRVDRTKVDATLDELDPELAPVLADADCPYVGLDAFRESTFKVFFGRERMVQGMVERLASERFLAVVGDSGSGKSSVVLAGVLPALRAGTLPGSAFWRYLPVLVPGPEPLENLVRALSPSSTEAADIASQAARLREDPSHLLAMAGAEDGRPCVLVIDQFEELFSLCEEEPVRQAFVEGLEALIQTPGLRHTVLLTMRSDYESRVAQHESFQLLFEQAHVRVSPLASSELREAILRPAELVGLKFEEGLVDSLLRDILGEPAGLPLLQFTLLKLWEGRERNRVTREAYRRLGGGRLALARSADELYDSLIPGDQVTARRILLRMVRTSERLEVTSSRIQRKDLFRGGEAPGWIDRVLDKLVTARLVRLTPGGTSEEDQFEVAHEALVRNWPRLVDWLEQERAEITTRRRLETQVEEWLRLKRQGGLLDEVQLLEAERWLASASAAMLGYHSELPALVQASRDAIEEGNRKEEIARQRELEQAHQLAEAERRRAEYKARSSRIFRALAAAMAVLLLVSLWASGKAYVAQRRAFEAQQDAFNFQKELNELSAVNEQSLRRIAEKQRDTAETQSMQQRMLRKEAEAALDEVKRQKARAEKALKELQQQKNRTDLALADVRTQKGLVEDALKDLRDQEQLTKQYLDRLLAQKKQTDLALADALAQTFRAEEARRKSAEQRDLTASFLDQAREALAKYEEQKTLADKAQDLNTEAFKHRSLVRAANRVLTRPQDLKLNGRGRPLHPGASISSLVGETGSLCCVVKDNAGRRYLLGLRTVFAGEPGTPVMQPGRLDGGTADQDKVAALWRVGKDKLKSGAIAAIDPDVRYDLKIPGIGKIQGIERTVYPGDKVRLVGRSSGIVEGTVIRVGDGEVMTTIVAQAGDIGAAVLAEDGELVGLLYAIDKLQSSVVRIGPILRELEVDVTRE